MLLSEATNCSQTWKLPARCHQTLMKKKHLICIQLQEDASRQGQQQLSLLGSQLDFSCDGYKPTKLRASSFENVEQIYSTAWSNFSCSHKTNYLSLTWTCLWYWYLFSVTWWLKDKEHSIYSTFIHTVTVWLLIYLCLGCQSGPSPDI